MSKILEIAEDLKGKTIESVLGKSDAELALDILSGKIKPPNQAFLDWLHSFDSRLQSDFSQERLRQRLKENCLLDQSNYNISGD